jgi:predicted membrane protein
MTRERKSSIMYIGEVIKDYTESLLIVSERSFNFVLASVALASLPLLTVLLLGLLFLVIYIVVGYYIALTMIAPNTAEKIMREEIIPYLRKKSP